MAPEGIATDGVDMWIVDDASDSVAFYAGAALFTSGVVAASIPARPDSTCCWPHEIRKNGKQLPMMAIARK